MINNDTERTRLIFKDLPQRERQLTDEHLEKTLKRFGAKKKASCERDCDCNAGMICRDRICQSEW
jgi:hypothetical protein